jgi:hypothetical protein
MVGENPNFLETFWDLFEINEISFKLSDKVQRSKGDDIDKLRNIFIHVYFLVMQFHNTQKCEKCFV